MSITIALAIFVGSLAVAGTADPLAFERVKRIVLVWVTTLTLLVFGASIVVELGGGFKQPPQLVDRPAPLPARVWTA